MSHLETSRTWYLGAPSEGDSWLFLSSPCLWSGILFLQKSRSRTCWPCLLQCTAEKLPCVLGSQPCVTQLQFRGYKGKGFASRLHTSKLWQQLLDQTERKEVACGSPKQTGVSWKKKQDPEESYWETMRKKPCSFIGNKSPSPQEALQVASTSNQYFL